MDGKSAYFDSREGSPGLDGLCDGRLDFSGEVEGVDCFITLLVLLIVGREDDLVAQEKKVYRRIRCS